MSNRCPRPPARFFPVGAAFGFAVWMALASPDGLHAAEPEPLNVLLTVEERANVSRAAQPVTAGVPLPKGLIKDADRLRIVSREGADVPAQFAVLGLWYPDRSVKWVQVDFQADVPAGGTRYFYLRNDGDGTTDLPGVRVGSPGTPSYVDTGVIAVELVRGADILGRVFLDESGRRRYAPALENPKSAEADAYLAAHSARIRAYRAQGGPNLTDVATSDVSVELAGPLHTVIKLEGKFVPWTGAQADPNAPARMNHVTRLHFYKGKPYIKVVHTIENLKDDSATLVRYDLAVTPNFSGDADGEINYRFGTDSDRAATGTVGRGGKSAVLCQDMSDHWFLSTGQPAAPFREEGRGKAVNPINLGYVDADDGRVGVLVGIRYFWQMWPKALAVAPGPLKPPTAEEGRHTVLACLLPGPGQMPAPPQVTFTPGLSRTHELILGFHKGDAPEERVRDAFMFLQKPLFAACEPEWYCQKTMAFGRIVDANPKSYKPEHRLLVRRYDDYVARSIDRIEKAKAARDAVDSYGFFHFGDVVDSVVRGAQEGDGAAEVLWSNNAEDYPHLLAVQFARTADLKYLDLLVAHGRHMADVCTFRRFPRNSRLDGTSRPWPAAEHVLADPQESAHYGFYQVEGLFDFYYLTGDQRAKAMGLLAAGRCRRTRYGGVREVPIDRQHNAALAGDIGRAMMGALAGYRETGEDDFLAVASEVLDRNRLRVADWQFAQAQGGDLEVGALVELYELSLREEHKETLLSCAAKAWDDVKQSARPAMARFWGFAAAHAENPRYIDRIVTTLDEFTRRAPANRLPGFAQGMALLPQGFWYLTDLPQK